MDKLFCPSYAIPGNHDSYPNKMWREIFGYDRQFSMKIGDVALILLDAFNNTPANGASDSVLWMSARQMPGVSLVNAGHF